MLLRRSTRLKSVKETPSNVESDTSSHTSVSSEETKKATKRSVKTAWLKSTYMTDTPESKEPKTRKLTTTKKNAKRTTKSISEKNSSSSEKVLTPPTPEITSEKVLTPPTPEITLEMLETKPWLSKEFLESVLEELKSSSTVTKKHPKMLSLVGPMASGKSTVKHQLHFNDAVNLDVDEVRIIAVKKFGQKAKDIFVDFAKIIQLLGIIIINSKYDFILDTTGKMKEPIKYVMKHAKEASYSINIAIVYSTRELCQTRAEHRNVTYTAREPVPIPVVGKVYDEFKESKRAKSYIMGIKDIVDMTDNLYLFDNSRCTPQAALIMERHGKDITVHEDFPDFYGVSVSQLSPKLVAHGIKKTRKNRKKYRKTRKQ